MGSFELNTDSHIPNCPAIRTLSDRLMVQSTCINLFIIFAGKSGPIDSSVSRDAVLRSPSLDDPAPGCSSSREVLDLGEADDYAPC